MTEKEQQQIFEDWFHRHKGLVFKVVRAYAKNAMDHDDLFQEIVIQLWRSVHTFRGESSETTWIYRISLNTAIKWKSKERKVQGSESLESIQHLLTDAQPHNSEQLTWLYEEIHKLDKIDRSITLLLLDDFSYKEIAAIMGITESHVGVKINRIKKYLITKSKSQWNLTN